MTRFYWGVSVALPLIALAATAALYPTFPERVPMHWNIRGEIDGYGGRGTLFIMPGVMLGLLGLLSLLPWLSPKQFTLDTFKATYAQVVLLVTGMMAYIQALILWAASVGNLDMNRSMMGGLCLFFALMGNLMGKVKRNMYVGVKTPWTLASERVWNDTHRLAGRLFVLAGVLGALVCLAFGNMVSFIVSMSLIGVAAIVPVVYSLVHYKRLEKRGEPM